MTEGKPLRAAIVGAGLMGKWHAECAKKIGASVAIVVDTDRPRADALAREFGATSRRTIDGALSAELVDIVHVCTPPSDHSSAVRSALLAGLHVICEKPLADTAAETAELYAAAAEKRLLLCPVHQYLFQDGVLRVMGKVPALGRLTGIASVIHSAGADGADDAAQDKLCVEILPHPLSLSARFAGLEQIHWSVSRSLPGEMQVIGSRAGISVSMEISTHARPTMSSVRVIGDHATANVDLFHGFASIDVADVSRKGKIMRPFTASGRAIASASANLARRTVRREPAYPGLRELLWRFYEAVRTSGAAPIDQAESLAVAAARDTIIRGFREQGALV